MKNISILILMLLISATVFSQTNTKTLLLTSSSIKQAGQISFQKNLMMDYKKLKTGGIVLIGAGTLMTAGGLIFLIDGTPTYTTNSYGQTEPTRSTYNTEYSVGSLLTKVGIHTIAGGIVMVVFANKRMIKKGMSFSYNPISPSVTYRF